MGQKNIKSELFQFIYMVLKSRGTNFHAWLTKHHWKCIQKYRPLKEPVCPALAISDKIEVYTETI